MSESVGAQELEQLRNFQKLTHAERLAWLWQAKLFALRALGAVRSKP
ncbi:MAG: hypothetical protein JWO36_3836 [Myxococcales bacterium]|nr:hypothetical protein [Myxococcales bacterium]